MKKKRIRSTKIVDDYVKNANKAGGVYKAFAMIELMNFLMTGKIMRVMKKYYLNDS